MPPTHGGRQCRKHSLHPLLTPRSHLAAPRTFEKVTVKFDEAASKDPTLLQYCSKVVADLTKSLTAKLTPENWLSSEGWDLIVSLSSVSVPADRGMASGKDAPHINGSVTELLPPTDNNSVTSDKPDHFYKLNISASQTQPTAIPGTDVIVVQPNNPDYYNALIASFTEHVVSNM